MTQEISTMITYQGNQITFLSDERNDYINITEMAKAWQKGKKPIRGWLKNKQTLDFLEVWEKKNNPNFRSAQMGTVREAVKNDNFSISIKYWIETTNAKGIFTRTGSSSSSFAHKDIAIRYAAWLSPEFELFLVEEIQRLKKIEEQKNSYELLSHEQILFLIRLKEVFKYVAHQEAVEEAHKQVYAAKSQSNNPFSDFNKWRNETLDINVDKINERIKQYCIDNKIPLTKKILAQTKREKILKLDSFESVRNATWDFLKIKEEINALNLANLVGEMIRTEKGEVYRKNETNLFHEKQDLGQFDDFEQKLSEMKIVKTAREVLADRINAKQIISNLSPFNKNLKTSLNYNPKEKK